MLHHELALVVLGAAVFLLTADDGRLALWTFLTLWVMRLSAKLNLFLGVRNLNDHFLPAHLHYLASYFRRRPMNALFPFSMLLSCIAALFLWRSALTAGTSEQEVTALVLVAVLLTLGIVEHALLVLPLPQDGLWALGLRSRAEAPSRR